MDKCIPSQEEMAEFLEKKIEKFNTVFQDDLEDFTLTGYESSKMNENSIIIRVRKK